MGDDDTIEKFRHYLEEVSREKQWAWGEIDAIEDTKIYKDVLPKKTVKIYNVDQIAETLMDELERNGLDSFVVLKDPNIGEWWGAIKAKRKEVEELERKKAEAKRKKEEDARAKKALLDRLTPEEKRLLGIKG